MQIESFASSKPGTPSLRQSVMQCRARASQLRSRELALHVEADAKSESSPGVRLLSTCVEPRCLLRKLKRTSRVCHQGHRTGLKLSIRIQTNKQSTSWERQILVRIFIAIGNLNGLNTSTMHDSFRIIYTAWLVSIAQAIKSIE